jgi:hypothetical protein
MQASCTIYSLAFSAVIVNVRFLENAAKKLCSYCHRHFEKRTEEWLTKVNNSNNLKARVDLDLQQICQQRVNKKIGLRLWNDAHIALTMLRESSPLIQ